MYGDNKPHAERMAEAAPEMYEALKSLAYFTGKLSNYDDIRRLEELFAAARAVIARAEGR